MRCPKCGFNSFDHNFVCPKCQKDLTAAKKLLGLSVPAPGSIDFFRAAGEEPLPQNAPSPPPPDPPASPDDIEDIMPLSAEPAESTEIEDIAPLEAEGAEGDDLEDIIPSDDDDEDEGEDIAPLEEAYESGQTASDPPENFAGYPADEIEDDEIEIELDDDETGAITETAPGADNFAAAMTQIKSALLDTGDLPPKDAEAIEAETIEAEDVEAVEVEVLEIAEDEKAMEPQGDSDFDNLSSLVSGLDLDGIEKKM